MKITITTQKEIEASTPVYRKWGNSYYRIDENACIKVDTYGSQIERFDSSHGSPWNKAAEDSNDLEFYTAYAATRSELNRLANVIDLQLNETGHD